MNNSFDGKRSSQTTGISEPLSAQQRRLWVLEQLERTTASQHIPVCVRIHGALDLSRLEEAFQLVHNRHHVLRSRFVMEKEEPRTMRALLTCAPLAIVELTSVPEKEREQSAYALLAKDLNQ